MRTMIRSTELGASTNVFFRVISQPVKCALTVTVHDQRKGKKGHKSFFVQRVLFRNTRRETKLVSGNSAHWETLLEMK